MPEAALQGEPPLGRPTPDGRWTTRDLGLLIIQDLHLRCHQPSTARRLGTSSAIRQTGFLINHHPLALVFARSPPKLGRDRRRVVVEAYAATSSTTSERTG